MFNKYQKMKILKNNGNKNGNNRQKNKEKILQNILKIGKSLLKKLKYKE